MSLVYYQDFDNFGKRTQMDCPDCKGVLWSNPIPFELDPPFPLIYGKEYECVECGKKVSLLFRNFPYPPLPNPMT
jgi:endogenous inhibitor of DNA gyrase (YacG/DUF329 family)